MFIGVTPISACNPTTIDNRSDNIVILYENDVHCVVEGYSKLSAMKKELKETHKNTAVTKGLISMFDVLVDGAYIEELKDIRLKFRGSSNQRVIDVAKSLEKGECVLYLE